MPAPPGLPPFPAAGAAPDTPAALAARGFLLRHARHDDLDWLCALYASTRAEELAQLPWPEAARQRFLADQFALQHRHYVAHYGDARFLVLERAGTPAGRYYLQCGAPDFLLVDISLVPALRGQGIGGALVADSQAQAARAGRGMALHVHAHNPGARRLYERLGFVAEPSQAQYVRMAWAPAAAGGPVS